MEFLSSFGSFLPCEQLVSPGFPERETTASNRLIIIITLFKSQIFLSKMRERVRVGREFVSSMLHVEIC